MSCLCLIESFTSKKEDATAGKQTRQQVLSYASLLLSGVLAVHCAELVFGTLSFPSAASTTRAWISHGVSP